MYRLSNSLPYLMARVGIRFGELFGRVLKEDGLSIPKYRAIAALAEEKRPLRLGELAALTSVDMSTLSRLVTDLNKAGLVLRERPEDNQRSIQVSLTAEGEAKYQRFMPIARYYEEIATEKMNNIEASDLKKTLRELYTNLDRLDEEVESGAIRDRFLR